MNTESETRPQKTISYLEGKAWYRLLKVVYIFFFIIILSFTLFFSYNTAIQKTEDVEATNVAFGFRYIVDHNLLLHKYNLNELGKKIHAELYSSSDIRSEDYVPLIKYKDTYSREQRAEIIIGSVLVLVTFFWLLSRIFFYIVLGSFFPPQVSSNIQSMFRPRLD